MLVDFKRIRNILIIFTLSKLIFAQDFSIARVHYDGGGDWYGDPSSIPNLLNYVQNNTSIAVNLDEAKIKITDSLWRRKGLIMCKQCFDKLQQNSIGNPCL